MVNPFEKLKKSLTKTKENFLGKLSRVVSRRKIDDELLDEIEEILIGADVGVQASIRLIEKVKEKAKEQKLYQGEDIISLLKDEINQILSKDDGYLFKDTDKKPVIWLIIGVNGVGKTTTIGKLATIFSSAGKKVIIAACDTFRAAAIEQISIWAERSNVEIIKSQTGSDPAAVAFDSAKAALARSADMLLVDTAGRLHTKTNLMEELKKIKRVLLKAIPEASIYSKLIIDGSTGQNAIMQVKTFTEAVGCDGIIMTKLDGSSKGGVLIALAEELGVTIDFIGIGETINDLQPFDAMKFTEALFT
ncbi:MAG: signal recognition particle-docking protein FtsY [Candidatus Zixiibacteriota bacterium]